MAYTNASGHWDDWLDLFRLLLSHPSQNAAQKSLSRLLEKEKKTQTVRLPFKLLCECFKLSGFEQICLLLAAAPSFVRDMKNTPPTLGLCADVYGLLAPSDPGEAIAVAAGRSQGLNVLLEIGKTGSGSCLDYTLAVNPLVCHFLSSPEGMFDQHDSPVSTPSDPPDGGTALYPRLLEQLSRFWEKEGGLLFLSGPRGGGKRTLLRRAAHARGWPLTLFDSQKAIRLSRTEAQNAALSLLLECIARESLPALVNVSDDDYSQGHLRYLTALISPRLPHFCVTGETLTPPENGVHITLPRLSTLERRRLWQVFSQGLPLSDGLDPAVYANKFHYTPGQVRDILVRARTGAVLDGRERVGDQDVLAAVDLKNKELSTGGRITRVECVFGWEDLVLPEEQIGVMRRLIDRVRLEHVVSEEWGFGRKLPYGRGVSAVVYGPPGTGKTMSAQVIARELGIALYRVDLSQMVSKYIGETEKNLSACFTFAERTGCILFFDEADALFGKRTEVKDAHDKYANVETSYLLQKIEEHEGISVLSTNNLNNIDTAFRRRFTYLINIPKPDAATRLLLWQKAFPKETPLSSALRFERLAEQIEFTGSAIKSAAVDAAYRAAAEGTAVEYRHLLEAVQLETLKNAMPLTEGELLALR